MPFYCGMGTRVLTGVLADAGAIGANLARRQASKE
jgi:hypothetical protein